MSGRPDSGKSGGQDRSALPALWLTAAVNVGPLAGADDDPPKRSGNELGDCECIDTICDVDSFCCENT